MLLLGVKRWGTRQNNKLQECKVNLALLMPEVDEIDKERVENSG